VTGETARVVVAATLNPNKVREMAPVLAPALSALGADLRSMTESGGIPADEDRETFAGNAVNKALDTAASLGLVALGEDSGLEVEALDGAPGVRSARFSGGGPEANNRLLLELMAGVPEGRRRARFCAAVALKVPGGPLFLAQGAAEGDILDRPRGERGFGYDPVFLSRDLKKSFAEAAAVDKNRVSHRSRALRAIRGHLFEAFPEVDFGNGGAEDGVGRPGRCGRRGRVPGFGWCLEALRRARCDGGLLDHQLLVARLCRETAFLLAEGGHDADAALVSAAGMLHDIAKAPGEAGSEPPGVAEPPPVGVTAHAWKGALWARRMGLDPDLQRVVMVHGLDSMVSPVFQPSTWEERILMLCDKLAEDVFVGLGLRIDGLKRRHPQAVSLVEESEPRLRALQEEVARAAGLEVVELERRLRAVHHDVMVFGPHAGADEVETWLEAR
jgi:XTP/dITP diphosphohydrolase